MPRVGFEPATPATKRPQTYALERSATGIGDDDDDDDMTHLEWTAALLQVQAKDLDLGRLADLLSLGP
jgi:hypothetical protein